MDEKNIETATNTLHVAIISLKEAKKKKKS